MDSWKSDPRIAARGFSHQWSSTVADGNGEDFFLDLIDEHLTVDNDLLDVGCGHGELTMQLAQLCRSAVGVDRDQTVIDLARELAAERQVDNVRFEVAALAGPDEDREGGPLPLTDDSIDFVVNRRGPALARYLDDLRRVARPGTVVIGVHPTGGVRHPPWAEALPLLADRFGVFSPDEVMDWVREPLGRANIDNARYWWIDVPEWFATPQDLYDRLGRGTPTFEEVQSVLEAIFERHQTERGIAVRHQRLVFAFSL